MGKKLGLVALVLGAFLVLLAGLSKFYMYDRLAVVPDNNETTSISQTAPGEDAEYLNVGAEGGPAVETGPLKSTRIVQGNVELSEKASEELDRDVAVWDTYTCTDTPDFDCASGQTPLSSTKDRVAFDAHTGETVSWSGSTTETGGEESEGAFKGLYFKFPFGTEKKTYDFWDGTLKKATPAVYKGETTIKGLDVYEFEQVIEPTKTGTIDVPGSLVGEDASQVTADRIYANTRTFLVEPVTGVIIKGGEAQDSSLEVDGERKLTTTKATLGYTDAYIQDTVDEYKGKATLLKAVDTTFPIVGGIVGLVLLVLGVAGLARGRKAAGRQDGGTHTA
ncbi:DUF3068 domain-containing protein [Aeromicrobium sp.]|uniref:DUF3068 domain-containing protein n=1 Tax=Aeromicrobium sp. TaxID=1871063 RepID=UPI0035141F63